MAFDRIRKAAWIVKKLTDGTFEGARPSYSQTGEDVIMLKALESKGIHGKQVRYLDLGANHPTRGSNTMLFYFLGGSGVLVEPSPHCAALCRKRRPRDTVHQAGVAAVDAGPLELIEFDPDVLSTFSPEKASEYDQLGYRCVGTRKVPVLGIDTILESYAPEAPPNLLSLDVEGMDEEIIDAIDFSKWRFEAICVETWDFGSHIERDSIGARLSNVGYSVWSKVGPNTVFIRNSP